MSFSHYWEKRIFASSEAQSEEKTASQTGATQCAVNLMREKLRWDSVRLIVLVTEDYLQQMR